VGSAAFFTLDPSATQSIFAVDVQDNYAFGGARIAPGTPADFSSTNSGNLLNWFRAAFSSIPIPALSVPASIIMILLLLFVSFRSLYKFSHSNRLTKNVY